jgi:hypothetical protein
VAANSEGWIPWVRGLKIPDGDLKIDIKFGDDSILTDQYSWNWDWELDRFSSRIVAYRVVKDTPKIEGGTRIWGEIPAGKWEKLPNTVPYKDLPIKEQWKATKAWWESAYNENPRWYEEGSHVKENLYRKAFPYEEIDIYRILQVYEVTDPCIQHAVKKLLCTGIRGYKGKNEDIQDVIDSLKRWQEMRKEEGECL